MVLQTWEITMAQQNNPNADPNARKKAHMDQIAKHYKILGKKNPFEKAHGMMRQAMDSGQPSYTSFKDMFDGGGPVDRDWET